MFVDDQARLHHMLDSAKKAIAFVEGQARNDLESNEMLALAIVRCLEIVGEAASKITRQRQSELSQIPWAQIIGMRNRIVHAYYDVQLDVVWSTVIHDLPPLIQQLEDIIRSEN